MLCSRRTIKASRSTCSSGELIVVLEGESYRAGQSSTLFYPGHLVHEYCNETDAVVAFYIVVDDTEAG